MPSAKWAAYVGRRFSIRFCTRSRASVFLWLTSAIPNRLFMMPATLKRTHAQTMVTDSAMHALVTTFRALPQKKR